MSSPPLTEDMIRITTDSIGATGRAIRDRRLVVYVGHHRLVDARGRPRRFARRRAAMEAARGFIAEHNQEAIPACAASMGCLCAGHARGNPPDDACDTRELSDDEIDVRDGLPLDAPEVRVGVCSFCEAQDVSLVATLVADPDQRVCAECHADPRVPTSDAP